MTKNQSAPEDEPELSGTDDEIDEDELDPEEMMDDGLDLGSLLTTEEGETIPQVLDNACQGIAEVARQISITNKLLVKLVAKLG